MPDAAALAKIRRAIDRRPHLMKQSLLRAGLRKEFLGGVASSEEKVAMALAAANQENALKTKPKVSVLQPFHTKNTSILHSIEDSQHADALCCVLDNLSPFSSGESVAVL